MIGQREALAKVLTPVAPPLIVDDVYTEDQHQRILEVIKAHGPWPSIIAHHFETVDEVMASLTGVVPEGHGMTLDDIATAQFRGFFGESGVCYYPELHDVFYSKKFLDLAKSYWGAEYAKPTMMLFNICGPHESIPLPHLDAVSFRGIGFDNTPVWIQNLMGKSGLFTDYLVNMTQVITWWYLGAEGTFTYWPDGPLREPQTLATPIWNRGVVVQNELMFHRGDPVGRPEERAIPGLKHRSMFEWRPETSNWAVTTDGEVVRSYDDSEMRLLVHWNAEVYRDLAEMKKVMDHTDDLTHDRVIETFLADLASKGVSVSVGADPFHEPEFIMALMNAYTIAPEIDWITAA